MINGSHRSVVTPVARALVGAALVPTLLLTGCSTDQAGKQVGSGADVGARPSPESDPDATSEPIEPTATASLVPPPEFDPDRAFEVIEYLADEIGPREATSDAFREAADWVELQFAELGYDVVQVDVQVPRGDPSYRPEWGTVVEPGTSANVIADPEGFDVAEPHVVIGAHLDTVAVSPGAEDNASGVGVLLDLARLATGVPSGVPVRFVAFGAEEPRGPGDDMHHFGSQQYVRELSGTERDAIIAMVSLDRVGVPAAAVPICTGGSGTTEVMEALAATAGDAGIDAETCENRASDHWSFEKAEIPAARLGSVPYGGYHSPGDQPDVVDPDQLDRVGTIVWRWLQGLDG